MTDRIHTDRSDPTIDSIIRATFPSYKGRKVSLIASTSVEMNGTAWDGGSKNTFAACNISNGQSRPISSEGRVVNIPTGAAIVEHTTFCGKDLGIRIHVHPETLAPLLTERPDLSPHELFVLWASSTLKASYGGKDRFDNSDGDRQYSDSFQDMTREDWEIAKNSLIARKLLNKRGAISNEGRNAVEGWNPRR